MISLGDRRPAWCRPAGTQQRRLPLRHKRLAEIIDLAKNLDDPIQHHRLRHSAMAAYFKKPFRHTPLIARKPLIRVIYNDGLTAVICVSRVPPPSGIGRARKRVAVLEQTPRSQSM